MDSAAQNNRIQKTCLMILATVAVGFVLYWFRAVLIPFVLAVFVGFVLAPFIELQHRRLRVPRPLATLVTLIVSALGLSLVGGLVSSSVRQLAANAASYEAQIAQLFDRALSSDLVQRLAPGVVGDEIDLRSLVPTAQLQDVLLATTGAIVDLLSNGLIVLIFLFFLLAGDTTAREGSVRAGVESKIRRYLVVQTLISMATGLLVGGFLMALDVPLAMVFGLFAFLLNFIPSIGSVIATLLPLPVVLMSPEITPVVAALAIGVPGTLQFFIGNVIAPKVLGDSLDLHPVTIVLVLTIWGSVWGIVGMLLAIPITAVMKMLMERLEDTRPLARLMSGHLEANPADEPS